jgi:hypothetical protein
VKFLRSVAPSARIAFDSGELAVTIPTAVAAADSTQWDAA